jgi:hypothetical protein
MNVVVVLATTPAASNEAWWESSLGTALIGAIVGAVLALALDRVLSQRAARGNFADAVVLLSSEVDEIRRCAEERSTSEGLSAGAALPTAAWESIRAMGGWRWLSAEVAQRLTDFYRTVEDANAKHAVAPQLFFLAELAETNDPGRGAARFSELASHIPAEAFTSVTHAVADAREATAAVAALTKLRRWHWLGIGKAALP